MIPTDLLDKLREADLGLWDKYHALNGELGAHSSDYIGLSDLSGEAKKAWLQHCLQEAIRARGWWYSLMTIDGVMATIARSGYPRDDDIIANGDTEAEALLAAYLAAIDEGKGDDKENS